jgi:tRNA threonylcarbamoyladenosine biosynthesis protein TsaE
MQFFCARQSDTEQLAQSLASSCPQGMVVYLHGGLGAGKSTFARAFIHTLGFKGSIKSPTYSLLEAYRLDDGFEAVHMDLYRLADPEEVDYLALDEYEKNALAILIEWPEKGAGHSPPADIAIHFTTQAEGRLLKIAPFTLEAKHWVLAINT